MRVRWLILLCGAIGAISLETDQGRRAVLDAIKATEADGTTDIDRKKLTTLILGIASGEARPALEALMQTAEYKSDFYDRIEASAEARGEAKSLVIVLEARGVHLTREQHDLIMSCAVVDTLDRWLQRAAAATSAEDVFKD